MKQPNPACFSQPGGDSFQLVTWSIIPVSGLQVWSLDCFCLFVFLVWSTAQLAGFLVCPLNEKVADHTIWEEKGKVWQDSRSLDSVRAPGGSLPHLACFSCTRRCEGENMQCVFYAFFALFPFSSWCLYNRPEPVAGENASCLWENSPVMECLSVLTIQMSPQISWRSDCSQGCLQIQGTFFDSWKESITGYIYLFSELQDIWHKPLSI